MARQTQFVSVADIREQYAPLYVTQTLVIASRIAPFGAVVGRAARAALGFLVPALGIANDEPHSILVTPVARIGAYWSHIEAQLPLAGFTETEEGFFEREGWLPVSVLNTPIPNLKLLSAEDVMVTYLPSSASFQFSYDEIVRLRTPEAANG